MKPQQTAVYSVSTSYEGEPLEIIGESFDLPIRQTDSVSLHTQIRFLTKGFELTKKTRRIAEEISQSDLEKIVNHYKDNLKEIFGDGK